MSRSLSTAERIAEQQMRRAGIDCRRMVQPPSIGPGRARQAQIYQDGVHGRRPSVPTDYATLERKAKRKASAIGWAYAAGGAGDGATMRANREAFERWRIVPRMLRDVSRRDLGVELFGRRLPAPLLLGPVGASELLHPRGDVAIAEGAAALGVPYIFTSQACAPMEECAAVMGDAPRWFQLYWSTDDGIVDSFLTRAKAAGAEAVVVTLDTTMLGWRPKDLNLGSLPFARGQGIAQYTADPRFLQIVRERIATAKPREVEVTLGAIRTLFSIARRFPGRFMTNLKAPEPRAAVETFLDIYANPALTWEHIESLRDRTDLPVLLKGIQHPDDARRALEAGVDGIVVSNHGGRQVDGGISSLDAMIEIAPIVNGKAKLLIDSGVRGGADVFKALALGADAVVIARPYLYGLALAGADGVRDVIANVIAEFDLTLGLSGLTSVAEITPDALRRI
jgi:isopentenyl diphosphate isomerase/L-lactate dehydrogenase-like FMN-dependent dehydrogenase